MAPSRLSERWSAIKALMIPWYQHRWVQVPLWSLGYFARYVWRNVYPLAALVAGVFFIVFVDQAREILANLVVEPQQLTRVDETRSLHATLFLAGLVLWALSTWYAMRLLSSTRFPGDHPPHPQAQACAHWISEELPRLGPLAAVTTVACSASIYMAEEPTARWMPFLAAGIVPLTWAVAWVGDRLLRGWIRLYKRPYSVQFVPTAAIALGAGAIGWWNLPELRVHGVLPFEQRIALGLACATLLLAWPWWLGRERKGEPPADEARRKRWRVLVDYAMLALAALWLGVAAPSAIHEAGFRICVIILTLAAAGLWVTSRRRDLLGIAEDPGTPHGASKPMAGPFKISRPTAAAIAITLGLLVALAIGFAQAPIALGNWMGTLAILLAGLALWSFFGAMWIYLPKLAGWPALGVVPILWLAVFGLSPDHSLRDTSYRQAAAPRPKLDEHFTRWRKELPPGENRPVFFVAAAGGGLRAAFWTANVLAAADDATCGEFGGHVYAYSGVSGGSLGVSAYLAQRQVWEEKKRKQPEDRCMRGRKEEITRLLGRDFLAPVAGSIMFAELAARFARAPLDNERGTTLAKSWSRAWDEEFGDAARGRFDAAFLEVFAPYAADGRAGPAVYLNATGTDSGQRVVAANIARMRETMPGIADLFRDGGRRMALKTAGLPLREAVLNSARFTYVSPAGAVHMCEGVEDGRCPEGRERIWERLVDGGYFENSGVATLSDAARSLIAAGMPKANVFVIVIDNSSTPPLACPPRGWPWANNQREDFEAEVPPLSGVTAPIEAFLNVREARARLEIRRLRADFPCGDNKQLLDWSLFGDWDALFEARRAQQQPPLGWFLSTRSANWMLKRVDQVAGTFPFRLAGCYGGPLSKDVRGVLGSSTFPKELCQ